MKRKPIRLHESDLIQIVERVLNEQTAAPAINVKNGVVTYSQGGTRYIQFDMNTPQLLYKDSKMDRTGAGTQNTVNGQPHSVQNYAKPVALNSDAAILGTLIKNELIDYNDLIQILKNPEAQNNATVKAINTCLRKYKPQAMQTWGQQQVGGGENGGENLQAFNQFVQQYYGAAR